MITAERLNNFSTAQKCYYTTKCGVYLATVHELDVSIDLYQVHNYYVEVYYEHGSFECHFAIAFTNTYHVMKYLRDVSINELFC